MSSIEERVANAILDLEGLLDGNEKVEQALAVVSADYGMRVDVLQLRAEQVLGPLSVIAAAAHNRTQAISRAFQISTAVEDRFGQMPTRFSLADLSWVVEKFPNDPNAINVAFEALRKKRIHVAQD